MDKISIVMPSYNSELYIEEAINSVINQSYTNWELLIVDDGSTDSTGKIIDSYSLKDNRIKVFHTINYGVSHARNIGLDNSTGEWINFMDSDDIIPTDALENLISNSKDFELVIGNFEYFPIKKDHYMIANVEQFERLKNLENLFIPLFSSITIEAIWGKLIKKNKINIRFDERYYIGEDSLFFLNLSKNIKGIKLIPNTVYLYRKENLNSLTNQFEFSIIELYEGICKTYINYFKNDEITSYLKYEYLFKVTYVIDMLFKLTDKSDDEIKNTILSIMNNDFFKSIKLECFPYKTKYQRLASVLLIGDIDLIMNEFKKNKTIRDK